MSLIAKVLKFNDEEMVLVGLKVGQVNLISSLLGSIVGAAGLSVTNGTSSNKISANLEVMIYFLEFDMIAFIYISIY